MRPLIQEIETAHTPESLVENLRRENGIVLLRTSQFDSLAARYSFVTANPFLIFRSFGSRCKITFGESRISNLQSQIQFGNPWHLLDALMVRFELLDEIDSAVSARRRVRLLGLRPEKFHRAQTPAPRGERPGIARLCTLVFTTAWSCSIITSAKSASSLLA